MRYHKSISDWASLVGMCERDEDTGYVDHKQFKIKTMYVCYIIMKMYVFVCINIFSPFYCLCITSLSHHFPTMNFI
jgi:hypothetical protein